MDPIVVLIITLTVAAGGGASGLAVAAYRHRRRKAMRQLLQRKHRHGAESVSLFDVFWDLGASDLALEMMRHEELLPEQSDGERAAHERLQSLVEAHGDYPTYVRETLEVIEEFEEVRRGAANRRTIPALESRARKLLAVDGDEGDAPSVDFDASIASERAGATSGADAHRSASAEMAFEQRVAYRESRSPSDLEVRHGSGGELLDVDDLDAMSIEDLIGSVFEGRFTETLRSWWNRRTVRGLKSDLDEAFEELYDFYVRETERRPDFYDDLFATAGRWDEEVDQIEALQARDPMAEEPVRLAADVLLEMAAETARSIARNAEANTRQVIEQIHAFARQGDFSMAGYLVYLNRNAFFAGRSPEYGSYVQRVENLAHRLQREVRELE
jgi:hypothetical protein